MTDKHKEWEFDVPLHGAIMDLIPQIVLHVDPIVYAGEFRGMKISDYQIKVLMLLHHAGKASPGFISRHLNIQKGSLTAVLKSLRKLEMIVREEVDGDERSYRVSLTDLGREFVEQHQNRCDKGFGELLDGMGEEDRNEAKNGLRVLIRHLEARGESHERP